MIKRKSPVRHKVKTHTRKSKRVNSYVRGSGKSKVQTKRKVTKLSDRNLVTLEETNFKDEAYGTAQRLRNEGIDVSVRKRTEGVYKLIVPKNQYSLALHELIHGR